MLSVSNEPFMLSITNLNIDMLSLVMLGVVVSKKAVRTKPGNTKGESITVQLTSCLTGLDKSILQIKTKIVSSQTADSKPAKQEDNGTVILPPLVFHD